MARTTVTTGDIRDRSVTSIKLGESISIGELTTNIIRNDGNALTSFYGPSGTIPSAVNMGKLLVSIAPQVDEAKIPTPAGSAYIAGDIYVEGNMTINGEQTTLNTATLNVEDNIIVLNNGVTGTNTTSAGIEINRGTLPNALIRWNESLDIWDITSDGGTTYNRIVDQSYGDGRYMSKDNVVFDDGLTITSTTDDILKLRQTNGGVNAIGFYSNSLEPLIYQKISSIGISSDELDLVITAPSRIYMSNNTYYNGNISMKEGSTVDGVDISAHNSNLITNVKHVTDAYLLALSGTSGTPSGTNKYVTSVDSRLSDARVPTTHGDGYHNNLSYFNSILDDKVPQNSKSATTTLRNIQFKGGTNISVTVTSDANNAGIVTISGSHNHEGLYVKLSNATSQVIGSDVVIGSVETPKSLTVQGDLTVKGTTTYLDSTHLNIGDNIVTLNNDYVGSAPTENAGLEINRGTLFKPQIVWDESDDLWKISNNGSNYYRILDETRADGKYLSIAGGSLLGTIETTIDTGSGLKVTTGDNDVSIWELNYLSGGYGFDLKYTGVQTGNDKSLELWADNQTGTAKRVYEIEQDGTMTIDQALTVSSAISMLSGANVTGNIAVTGTVDGRDISEDGLKIDPMHTVHTKRARRTTKLVSALTQDTTINMDSLGFTGLSWGSTNMVLVVVDGQINAPGYDYTLGATNTIVFLYEIPADSIIEIIVM